MQMHTKPAAASAATSFDEAMAANAAVIARFRSLPATLEQDDPAQYEVEVQRLIAASRAADAAAPTSWADLGRWVEHLSDDGANTIDDDNAARLLAHVRRLLVPAAVPGEWGVAYDAYKRAEGDRLEYERSNPNDEGGRVDSVAEAAFKAAEHLLSLPAPNASALAWKLDYLFAAHADDNIPGYAHSYIKQTLDDAVRLASAGQRSALA